MTEYVNEPGIYREHRRAQSYTFEPPHGRRYLDEAVAIMPSTTYRRGWRPEHLDRQQSVALMEPVRLARPQLHFTDRAAPLSPVLNRDRDRRELKRGDDIRWRNGKEMNIPVFSAPPEEEDFIRQLDATSRTRNCVVCSENIPIPEGCKLFDLDTSRHEPRSESGHLAMSHTTLIARRVPLITFPPLPAFSLNQSLRLRLEIEANSMYPTRHQPCRHLT
jgi:hypothetical protein